MAEENTNHLSRVFNFGVLDEFLDFGVGDASYLNPSTIFNPTVTTAATGTDLQSGTFNMTANSKFPATFAGSQTIQLQKGLQSNLAPILGEHHENWGEFNMTDSSSCAYTATDMDGKDKNQQVEIGQSDAAAYDSGDKSEQKNLDQKRLRRLALNREAARKCRVKKKAYVEQLEDSRQRLTQLEQEKQRALQQGTYISRMGDQSRIMSGNGPMAFDTEYARWLEEHNRHINELRIAANSHASDPDLRIIVDKVATHFNDIFRLKGIAAKADVFHILSGMWKTPAERCFMWIGGFRPSKLLKLLVNHLEPLTEQQVIDIRNLEQLSHNAEDVLSLEMEALKKSLAETLVNGTWAPEGSSENVAIYMGQMASSMGKLVGLEGFLHQADNLRQCTLQNMHAILTTRQSARATLRMHDYFRRVRALSTLWLARPRE